MHFVNLLILRSYKLSDELKDHFSSYGKVVEDQIMFDHSTGRSRGFGFVTFESEDAVERVISEGRMRDLGGKQVRFFYCVYVVTSVVVVVVAVVDL